MYAKKNYCFSSLTKQYIKNEKINTKFNLYVGFSQLNIYCSWTKLLEVNMPIFLFEETDGNVLAILQFCRWQTRHVWTSIKLTH